MRIGRYYYNAYGLRNPAGLINDAGYKHANTQCNKVGRIVATKGINEGDELYWCYHQEYWRTWGPRAWLPTREEEEAERRAAATVVTKGPGRQGRRRKGGKGLGRGGVVVRRQLLLGRGEVVSWRREEVRRALEETKERYGRERRGDREGREEGRRGRRRRWGAEDAPT